jgi:hypothetical protein
LKNIEKKPIIVSSSDPKRPRNAYFIVLIMIIFNLLFGHICIREHNWFCAILASFLILPIGIVIEESKTNIYYFFSDKILVNNHLGHLIDEIHLDEIKFWNEIIYSEDGEKSNNLLIEGEKSSILIKKDLYSNYENIITFLKENDVKPHFYLKDDWKFTKKVKYTNFENNVILITILLFFTSLIMFWVLLET